MITNLVPGSVRARWRRLHAGDEGEAGFAGLELAVCAAFVVIMLLVVVALGRAARGRQLVDQAAQAAARAGSLTLYPGAAQTAAQQAAEQTLSGGGLSCHQMTVSLDTSAFYPGGQVVAHVSCVVDLSGLALTGVPGQVTLQASSTSPLEHQRQLSITGGAG